MTQADQPTTKTVPVKVVDPGSAVFHGAPAAFAFVRWYCKKNNIPQVVQSARTFERHMSELIDNSADSELLRCKTRTVTRARLVEYVRSFYPQKTEWLDK